LRKVNQIKRQEISKPSNNNFNLPRPAHASWSVHCSVA